MEIEERWRMKKILNILKNDIILVKNIKVKSIKESMNRYNYFHLFKINYLFSSNNDLND